MDRFSKILVTVDVTADSFGAAGGPGEEALALAEVVRDLRRLQQHPGQLTVLTVLPQGHGDDPAVEEAARRSLRERFVPQLEADDVEVQVGSGVPFLEVIREVLRGDHDLVFVAARSGGDGGRIVSHMATQLIRKCPCPVWVAPRQQTPFGKGSILAAVGLHQGLSSQVVQLAASMAKLTERQWNVLHVPEYPLEGGMRLRNAESDEIQAYEDECRKKAWAELHGLTDGLAEELGLKPKLWMAEGRPSEQIVKAEEQLEACLIVMGTISRGGLAGMVIGTTAERAIAHARSSVLAVKPEDFVCPVEA